MRLQEAYFLLLSPNAEKIIGLLKGRAASAEEISERCKIPETVVWKWLGKALKLGLVLHFKERVGKKTLYITHIDSREILYKGNKFRVVIEFDDGSKKELEGIL